MSLESLGRLARNGGLRCLYGDGEARTPTAYHSGDIQELRWAKKDNLSLPALHRACLEAKLSSRRALEEVKRIETVLGLRVALCDPSSESVVALYKEAAELLLARSGEVTAELLFRWGARMLGMDEAFFAAVQLHVVHLPEPWTLFLKLGEYLAGVARRAPKETTLLAAAGYLEAGRRNVRNQAVLGGGIKGRTEEEELLALVREMELSGLLRGALVGATTLKVRARLLAVGRNDVGHGAVEHGGQDAIEDGVEGIVRLVWAVLVLRLSALLVVLAEDVQHVHAVRVTEVLPAGELDAVPLDGVEDVAHDLGA